MGPKLWSIQALRFVAAAMVVHLHAAERAQGRLADAGIFGHAGTLFGRSGVDLFFVISGLIIARTGGGLGAGAFLAKRARRILPMYSLLAAPWIVWAITQGRFGWREALASFALWPATDRITPPALPTGWTLCYEALFYLAFGAFLWRRWTLAPLLGALAFALLLPRSAVLQYVGNPLILEFLLGVLLARSPATRWALWGIPIGLAVLVAGAALSWPPFGSEQQFLSGVDGWVRLLDCGVPAALIVWGALQIDWKPGALTQLGDASYAIYLTHAPIVASVVLLSQKYLVVPADMTIAVAVVVASVFGWRVHVLFEKPLQRLLARPTLRPFAAAA